MSLSGEQSNEVKLTEALSHARHEAEGCDYEVAVSNILTFIENNPGHTYYSIVKLLDASNTTELDKIISSVLFLSSKKINIFTLQFCYFPKDKDENIEITQESYFEAMQHGYPPVDARGNEISDFDTNRLGFTCYIHPELRHARR